MKTKMQSLLTLGFLTQAFILSAHAQTGVVFTTLHSFPMFPNGRNPVAGLVEGSDGNFYGTTDSTVFEMTPDGVLTTLASDLAGPSVVPGRDGNFYGTTYQGGPDEEGTVFKINTNGTLTTLYCFTGGSDGGWPNGLVQGSDGCFYGTTDYGGTKNFGEGTVFKISTNGTLTTLYSFGSIKDGHGDALDGANPQAELVQGSDGYFYGTTVNGGTSNDGTVFKINTHGVLTSLHSFSGKDGSPDSPLAQGRDGYFYGTTYGGGIDYGVEGTVFKISSTGGLLALASFQLGDAHPHGLVQGSDGFFYGTTAADDLPAGYQNNGTVFKISTNGTLTTFYSFTTSAYPAGQLVEGSDGNFYGTTEFGGQTGDGSVFRISTNGALGTLYSFMPGSDGNDPDGVLVEGSDGNFYGTTSSGGTNGGGTMFQVTTNGTLTTLVSFNGANGSYPVAGLVQGTDGNFYGTTAEGGTNGVGTVFKISANGLLTRLYSFGTVTNANGNLLDGANPQAGLVPGSDGNFYGTTDSGGTNGFGTVFEINTNGVLTSLYSFGTVQDLSGDALDGANPQAGLVQGSDGCIYGTTEFGGNFESVSWGIDEYWTSFGTVFKISTNGTLTSLYAFGSILDARGDALDGADPQAPLVQGSDGNFYGTTEFGGICKYQRGGMGARPVLAPSSKSAPMGH